MIGLLFLPVRLACRLVIGILSIPFLLVGALFQLIGALILLPFVLLLTVVGVIFGGFALLIPILLLGAFVWMLARLFGSPSRQAL